jgi:protein SEY1
VEAKHCQHMQVPASALHVHMQQIWRVISEQKDLDLPAHKVMVANIRCKDIAQGQLKAATSDQAWTALVVGAVEGNEVQRSFGKDAAALIESCLFGYDSEAMYFVDSVRSEQKKELEVQLYAALHKAFAAQLKALQGQLSGEFLEALETAAAEPEHPVATKAVSLRAELLSKYTGALTAWARATAFSHMVGRCLTKL